MKMPEDVCIKECSQFHHKEYCLIYCLAYGVKTIDQVSACPINQRRMGKVEK
jgi:hypothetical protein